MKRLFPVFLILALMSGSVYADDLQEGIDAYENQDNETAREKFLLLAEKGNAVAQYYLGSTYIVQPTKAIKWLTRSANQGYAKAMVRLAWHHKMDKPCRRTG